MTVPPPTVVDAKPNWIQDAEAIAKADINRLEGELKASCKTLWAAYGFAVVALVIACLALGRTCR